MQAGSREVFLVSGDQCQGVGESGSGGGGG